MHERPKPKPLSEINIPAMIQKVVNLVEETLDDLDEGFNPDSFKETGNENEDILEDNNEGVYEAVVEAVYGPEYWDYFNERTCQQQD